MSVPLPGNVEGEVTWKGAALSVVALAIAGLTGLSAFFQWQGFRQTQFAPEHLLSR